MALGALTGAAVLGAAGIGAAGGIGSSIAGNVANRKSVADTNATNMQIAQMNNEWSEKMMEKQMAYNDEMFNKQANFQREMNQTTYGQSTQLQKNQFDYNTEMWNKTNEYNSAENQRKRLEQAGLNPYLMMSGGSAGTASAVNGTGASAGSSGSPSAGGVGLPSPSQISAQAPQYDFSAVGSSIMAGLDMYNKLKLGKEQADNLNFDKQIKNIELQFKSRQIMQDLANKIAEEKNLQAKTKSLDTLREFERANLVANTNNTIQQTQNLKETMKSVVLQNAMDYLTLQNMPKDIALRQANTAASTAFMVAQKAMTEQQAINENKKSIILDYQARKEKISADYAERMAKNLYLQAESTLRRMTNNEAPADAWQQSYKDGRFGRAYRGSTYTWEILNPFGRMFKPK